MGFMLVDRLATRLLRYFLKINFVPSWDEVLGCNLHQSKAWRFCVVNSCRGDWNFKNNKMTSGQFVQRDHQVPSRISKISLLQLSVKWNSVISCLSQNWEYVLNRELDMIALFDSLWYDRHSWKLNTASYEILLMGKSHIYINIFFSQSELSELLHGSIKSDTEFFVSVIVASV